MPPDISPIAVIREAIRAVPAVKYALAVGGVLSILALVKIYGLDPKIAFVGLIITFAFMGIMLVFAHATKLHGSSLARPAVVFVWFTLVMFMLISASLFSSVFGTWPLDLHSWLTQTPPLTVAPVVETKPLPEIPMADSGWVGGGSSPGRFCGPVFDALKLKYPDFVVSMQLLPEQHRSEFTPFKHDYYRYTCSFSVAPKT